MPADHEARRPNAELAYRTLDAIDAHRAHFNMNSWADGGSIDDRPIGLDELTDNNSHRCKTTACFAGWAVALSGYQLGPHADVIDTSGDRVHHDIGDFAANLLGLDNETGGYLFYVEDDEINGAVERVFGPRPS